MKKHFRRAFGFGVTFWIFIFVIPFIIIMVVPGLQGHKFYQFLILWVLMVPFIMLLSKWYFRVVTPSTKNGLMLGVFTLVIRTVLDAIIVVPLFVKSYTLFYGNLYMYIGMLWGLLLMIYAGYEFDRTYTKPNMT